MKAPPTPSADTAQAYTSPRRERHPKPNPSTIQQHDIIRVPTKLLRHGSSYPLLPKENSNKVRTNTELTEARVSALTGRRCPALLVCLFIYPHMRCLGHGNLPARLTSTVICPGDTESASAAV